VGEAASQLGITPKTLKAWEKKGDIPKAGRNYKGDRVYTAQDIEQIKQVKGLDQIHRPDTEDDNLTHP
jgi:DNA-binding transcriptional MerR regulator